MKNEELRKKIQSMPCIVTGKYHNLSMGIIVDCAHVKTYGSTLIDSEWNMIPLSRELHLEQHRIGIGSFIKRYPQVKNHLINLGWTFEEYHGKLILSHPELIRRKNGNIS